MSRIAILPKNWKFILTTTYPGGFIALTKIECRKKEGSAHFFYSRWGGCTVHNSIGDISKNEEVQLEAYCDRKLNDKF